MRADDLILFSQVIELGSFSKVAEANNLTNSVVSKRMARLEEEIGAQLLYRTTRKLTLTEAGKVLLHSAKNVKQATQEAMDAVAVAEFCNLHPGLTVDMSLDNRFVDLVADGYDLVIRTGYLADSSLIARHILDSQWVVCASPSYIAKNGKPIEPIDLTTHNCLQYAYQTTGATDWEFKGEDGNYIVKVSGCFSTDNATALRKAALGGHGIAYVPRCLVYHDIRNGQLVDIFPELVGKKLGIYAVYPFTRQPPNKVKLLIEHIRDRYLTISHYF
ncbi:TPA: LysR family transcriptional regulator [Vibrio alginolyticus]